MALVRAWLFRRTHPPESILRTAYQYALRPLGVKKNIGPITRPDDSGD